MANKITTVLDLDGKNWRSGLADIKKSITEADGASAKLKAGWAGVLGQFKASPGVIAGATAAVGAFAAKAIGDASALEESINAVNVAYGQNADEVLAIGENASTSLGLAKSEFNQLAVSASSFVSTIAASSGRSVPDVLAEYTTRIADFASVMNLDLTEATQVFMSTLAGETEPIRRFGKDVSAAAVEQFALSEGLVKSKSEMTEAIKVQARYGLLMQQTADTAGDFANTSEGLANQQRILSAQITDISAQFGQKLIPVVADAARTVTNLITVYDELGDKAGGGVGEASRGIFSGTFLGQSIKGISDLADATEWLKDKVVDHNDVVADGIDSLARARSAQDRYVEGLVAQHEAASTADESARAGADAQDRYVDSLIAAGEAAIADAEALEEKARAEEEAAEEAARHREIVEAVTAAMEAQRSAALELVGGELAVRDAQRQAAESRDELNAVMADGESTTYDVQAATDNAAGAYLNAAQQAADFRAKQMEANGEAVNSQTMAQLLKEELQNLASQLDGPLAAALQAYIDQLNAIPRNVTTNIQANFNSRGDNPGYRGAHASGGTVNPGGMILAGESGPELINVPGGAHVYTAAETQAMMNGGAASGGGWSGGAGATYNITFNVAGALQPQQVVEAIKRFERANGAGWRS